VPERAAKLAVGHGLKTDLLLQAHDVEDGGVLQGAQILRRHRPDAELFAGGEQRGWPQKAADMVGPVGRRCAAHAHGVLLPRCLVSPTARGVPGARTYRPPLPCVKAQDPSA